MPTANSVIRLLIAALVLLAASCGTPEARLSDRQIAARLGEAGRLVPFYAALYALERGKRAEPVAVLQIGDSHTANDAFSGRMRELLQARFGDAGRGVLPPGIPHRWYKPARVRVTSEGWTVVSSFAARVAGPFGLAGLRQHSDGPAEMTLEAETPGDLDRMAIEVLEQPGGGTLEVSFDDHAPKVIATEAPRLVPGLFRFDAANASRVTVHARGDGPVDVLAWSAGRRSRGATYANFGTVGATVDLLGRWDPAIVKAEMTWLRPSLIVVAFGTNEAFEDATDTDHYAMDYAARVQLLRDAAPEAALLVIGPPDGNRRRQPNTAEADVCGADPDSSVRPVLWAEPANLAPIREAQRRVADAEGFYFWDWSAAMGGRCAMWRLVKFDPAAAAPDHVHLFAPGYRATAERLFAELMEGYDRYRALKRGR